MPGHFPVSGRRREIKLKTPLHTGNFNPAAVWHTFAFPTLRSQSSCWKRFASVVRLEWTAAGIGWMVVGAA
jgi:hypothetical protein